jgi:hypothetical protein
MHKGSFVCKGMCSSKWRDCLGIEPSGDGTRLPKVLKTQASTSSTISPEISIYISYTMGSKLVQIILRENHTNEL